MRLAPPSAAEAKKLQKQLMQAGFRSEMPRSSIEQFNCVRSLVFLSCSSYLRFARKASGQCPSLDSIGFRYRFLPPALSIKASDKFPKTARALGTG